MPNVKVATRLREIYEIPAGAYTVDDADTVKGIVDNLESNFPGIRTDLLIATGNIRPDVIFYLDGDPVDAANTDASLEGVRTVRIIQAMAGG